MATYAHKARKDHITSVETTRARPARTHRSTPTRGTPPMTQDYLWRKGKQNACFDCAKLGQKGTRATRVGKRGGKRSRGGAHALPKWSDGRRAPSARMRRAKKRPRSTHERRAADGRDVHTPPKESTHLRATQAQPAQSTRSQSGATGGVHLPHECAARKSGRAAHTSGGQQTAGTCTQLHTPPKESTHIRATQAQPAQSTRSQS
jgi:hypothetical protein